MALLERVSTLIRANINDLLRKAEDPEKLGRQLLLDMENQLMQVKTQMAMAIADQHVLRKRQRDEETAQADWVRKAELAVARQQDDVARAGLERAVSHGRMAEALGQQHADQTEEVEALRGAFSRLQQKLGETRSEVELLIRELRRSKTALQGGATKKKIAAAEEVDGKVARLRAAAEDASGQRYAARVLTAMAGTDSAEARAIALEREDQVDRLLRELKERQNLLTDRAG